MVQSRILQKAERVTVTLVPNADARSLIHIPSTFNKVERTYGWRHSDGMNYMIVPIRISNTEIKIDVFVNPPKGGKLQPKNVQKVVQAFIEGKIESDWRGLKLGGVSRPTVATPPNKSFVRGTIEEMLGAAVEG